MKKIVGITGVFVYLMVVFLSCAGGKAAVKQEGLESQYRNFKRNGQYFYAYQVLQEIKLVSFDYDFIKKSKMNIVSKMSNYISAGSMDIYMMEYAKAFLNYIDGNISEAIPYLKVYNTFKPDNSETSNQLILLEKYLRFERINQELLKEYNEAQRLFDISKFSDAFQKFNRVIEIYDNNKNDTDFASYNLSRYEVSKRQIDEIRKKLSHKSVEEEKPVHEINPEKSEALYADGMHFYTNGRIREASMKWDAALRYNPDNEKAKTALERAKKELAQ